MLTTSSVINGNYNEEIEAVRKEIKENVPEDRLQVIARNRKLSEYAKELLSAQSSLSRSNFIVVANKFLSISIEESMRARISY